jgi:hypothetical protein
MRKFIYASEKFDGVVLFGFNEQDRIVLLDVNGAALSKEQHAYLFMNIPANVDTLLHRYGRQGKVEEVVQAAPLFVDFWAEYFKGRHKDNSSKKKAEIKWNRMSGAQQSAAFKYIGRYMANVSFGTVPKLAETYLGSEVWE